jgi:hypothetical protein
LRVPTKLIPDGPSQRDAFGTITRSDVPNESQTITV